MPSIAASERADPAASPVASASADARARLVAAIDALLPQTQCERCGQPGCLPYARAVADGESIGRCAPGGPETIANLARLLGRAVVEPDPDCPSIPTRLTAVIDESSCIGCVKCVLACPVDAIVGAPRHRHRVLPERCTGCELCLPPCPVDCIRVEAMASPWTAADAARARQRHEATRQRRTGAGRDAVRTPLAAAPDGPDPTAIARLSDPGERSRRLARILASAQRPG
jgi:electron transport complex protein RnfB